MLDPFADDASYPLDMAERLEQAPSDAGVSHVCEIYPCAARLDDADIPVHDGAAAERGWRELLALFARNLG